MKVKNILLIEDDPFFAKGFLKRLENLSEATLHVEESIENTIKSIDHIRPDIIFLDHYLQGENGVDALPKLKTLCPFAEVVVVSNSTELAILKSALDNGAVKYFSKDSLLNLNVSEFVTAMMEKSSGYKSFWEKFIDSFKGGILSVK